MAASYRLEATPFCESCVSRITEDVAWMEGVSAVEVKVGDPIVKVWHDPATVPPERILEALDKAGEKASLVP